MNDEGILREREDMIQKFGASVDQKVQTMMLAQILINQRRIEGRINAVQDWLYERSKKI